MVVKRGGRAEEARFTKHDHVTTRRVTKDVKSRPGDKVCGKGALKAERRGSWGGLARSHVDVPRQKDRGCGAK